MSTVMLGSCRLSLRGANDIKDDITYTHSTKEVIQLLHYLQNGENYPEPYNKLCFRSPLTQHNKTGKVDYDIKYKNILDKSKIVFIEICSRKLYKHKDYHLYSLHFTEKKHRKRVDKKVLDEMNMIEQTDEEIEQDILKIIDMLSPRKIFIVTHCKYYTGDGVSLDKRDKLINLLNSICKKHNIPVINPIDAFKDYKQWQYLKNSTHYKPNGNRIIREYYRTFLYK